MPIKKYYEFACDNCGQAEFPPCSSIADGKKFVIENGAVITRSGKYYCTKACFTEAKV